MREEKDLRKDMWKGEQAKMIMNSPLIVDYFNEKRRVIMNNLETSKWNNKEEQEDLIRMLKVLANFEKDFKQHMRGGDKAKSLLNTLLNRG